MAKTLFSHINAIFENQDKKYFEKLDESDKKTYSQFMVNRFLSMRMQYVPVVNEIQKYWSILGDREQYLFYSQLLPRGKQWNPYIKAKKVSSYEKWVIELIAKHYEVSIKEAETYVDIFYLNDENKLQLKEICEMRGISTKLIKQLKLG